ncbi:MAG: penicillin-binding protein 2 [Actinomycetota bacterium]
MSAMNNAPDRVHLRVAVLGLVFLSLVVALVLRLWFLQVLAANASESQAQQNQVRVVPTVAARGDIVDRNGNVLVSNRLSLVVSVERDKVAKTDRANKITLTAQGVKVMDGLSALLGIPVATLMERLKNTQVGAFAAAPVAADVPQNAAVFLKEHQDYFPGVSYSRQPLRFYPDGTLAAQALGIVGPIDSTQLRAPQYKGYQPGTIIGRSGLEAQYERYLQGQDGLTKLQVAASGSVRGVLGSKEPVRGQTLVTTIDATVQKLVEKSLADGMASARKIFDKVSKKDYLATGAGAIVMDPNTGRIVAMASSPTYDPTAFAVGISDADYNAQFRGDSSGFPLINRTTQAQYPPGSTFKVVPSAAAVADGIAAPSATFPCPGSVRLFNQSFNNWQPNDSGAISLPQALVQSCDTVFYNFGAEFYRRFTSGQGERLQAVARDFGFGSRTGVDLPGEDPGRVPDKAWVENAHKQDPTNFPYSIFQPGYDIQMAIGQGDLLATPLQLASAYAAIANGGTLYQPQLALKVMNGDQVVTQMEPKVIRHLSVPPEAIAEIQQGLQGVTTLPSGTASGVFASFPFNRVTVSAKTGTADVNGKQPIAWFASYAPAVNPQYVVVVMLEQGGHGGETSAPIARKIIEGLFNLPSSATAAGVRTD